MRRRLFVGGGALLAAAGAAAAAALLAWPAPSLGASESALAHIGLPNLAGRVTRIRVTAADGTFVPVRVQDGELWPERTLAQGERLTVQVSVHRPRWASWLVGRTVRRTFTVTTPSIGVRSRFLRLRTGSTVTIPLDAPAAVVSIDGTVRRLGIPAANVPAGVAARGRRSAGSIELQAAPRLWETLSTPVRVSWFPRAAHEEIVATPRPGTTLRPDQALTLTFSAPVAGTVAEEKTRLLPATPGHWRVVDPHTVTFAPAGLGYPFGGSVRLTLPKSVRATLPGSARTVRTLTWPVAPGSPLRLQQLLAQLGYLPVGWQAQEDPAPSDASEIGAALSPPAGTFWWRYPHTPPELSALWHPGRPDAITRGALMRFESDHGLAADGVAGPHVWRSLISAALADERSTQGYSYVFVHESVPESLNLWHNGRIVVKSPGNTGIAQAPTQTGTYPVFEHIPLGTMEGTNPDGSHYHDAGVQWISYFHGGDAIHAFNRTSYGTPQSLGCVELPLSAAAQVWPYTPIGTLVTIEQ